MIILPAPFEAVFVRINPTAWSWGNSIALRVEFYGCKLNQTVIPGNVLNYLNRFKFTECRFLFAICTYRAITWPLHGLQASSLEGGVGGGGEGRGVGKRACSHVSGNACHP